MRLLDLFCGAGGAAMGYHRAGFEVVGVDINPQPHYPFEFIQADALDLLRDGTLVGGFDAIHASPPCQAYAITQNIWKNQAKHPDLIAPTRELLLAVGLPYAIENVEGARRWLHDPVRLCGEMFGLRVLRHRLFESSHMLVEPIHLPHLGKASHGHKPTAETYYMTLAGHWSGYQQGADSIGIDWMTRDELSQAIPPAYTEWIGRQLLAALEMAA